ncbi:MAG TPA: MFS transporter [Alphaproteobacteria bacterium]|nr:MFS transporter [Alphaproteobacteria bacterium]
MALNRRAVAAWCFYDWANSAFPTIIVTFVFSRYFTEGVADDPNDGAVAWNTMMALVGIPVAILAPILGAIADNTGRRKPWLGLFTVATALLTLLLWPVKPEAEWMGWALAVVLLASLAFEFGQVFYNAMLPTVAPEAMLGRVSGWGWGLGYLGGLFALVAALFGLIQGGFLPTEQAENVRAVAILVPVWYLLFSLPLFLFVPDAPPTGVPMGLAVRRGLGALLATLRQIRHYREIAKFLVARALFSDGLNTLFANGAIFAAYAFGLDAQQAIIFGIAINVTSGLGAIGFAWIDDWIGPKRTILLSLLGLMATGLGLLVVRDVAWFWPLGLALGIFVGPAQAASRTLLAHMAPRGMENEMFGLFALSGRAVAFIGPALYALATALYDSQRAGMTMVLLLFVLGFVGMLFVRPVRAEPVHG